MLNYMHLRSNTVVRISPEATRSLCWPSTPYARMTGEKGKTLLLVPYLCQCEPSIAVAHLIASAYGEHNTN